MNLHGKTYANKAEHLYRFIIYQKTVNEINEHNERESKGLESYKMGTNIFSDLTN